ncbi:MAG TPA: hypothetical protein VK524_34180, partial [Polyangiaceae bacterium]|nr:hypothetical protein [Polyangiaceae bacterium]
TQAGARANEPAAHYYAARSVWYVWGGCRPSITVGQPPTHGWPFSTEGADSGYPALHVLHEALPAEQVLVAICPRDNAERDPICSYAGERRLCREEGSDVLQCRLSGADRHELLRARR